MLVNHPDAQINGVVGLEYSAFLPRDEYFTFIRQVKSIEDIHQGAFTGTVFTQ